MNTFLLYWNPYFSSYKLSHFADDFDFENSVYPHCLLAEEDDGYCMPYDFNWSVVEYSKAHEGDRFFFVRVGYDKPTGLIGAGVFTSEPYKSDDWSGQGRSVYYMDMEFESVVDATSDRVLATDVLTETIPEIDWTRGRAGVMIAPHIAEKIESLWMKHLNSIKEGKR